jgi:hypothetical protein
VLGQSLAVWARLTEPALRPTGTLGNPNARCGGCGLRPGLAGLWGLTPRSFLLVLLSLPLVLATGSRGARGRPRGDAAPARRAAPPLEAAHRARRDSPRS